MFRNLLFVFGIMSVSAALAEPVNSSLVSSVTCDIFAPGFTEAVLVQADGKVVVGGDFSVVNGKPVANLVRLTKGGALDTEFQVEVDDVVTALASDGEYLYVGGCFENINDEPRNGIARLKIADGSLDEAWVVPIEGDVSDIKVAGSNLYIAGLFDGTDDPVQNIARLDKETGELDLTWMPAPDDEVISLAVTEDHVYLCGYFDEINGVELPLLARINKETGTLDETWNPQDIPWPMTLAADTNNLYVGCMQQRIASVQTDFFLHRFDFGSGQIDTNWNPRVVGTVLGIALDGQNVYAAGDFNRVSGVVRRGVARISKANGALDAAWHADVDNFALALAPSSDGIYVAGNLTSVGTEVVSGIARLDAATGALDATFNAVCETEGRVIAAKAQSDGSIVVGGNFYRIGNEYRSNLARIAPDGTVDPFWRPDPDHPVLAVAIDGDAIFVGGFFSQIGGASRLGVARLNTLGGAADPDWQSPLGSFPIMATRKQARAATADGLRGSRKMMAMFNVVSSIVADNTGVYIAGLFITTGNKPILNLAKLDKASGSPIHEFMPGLEFADLIVTMASDGARLYVAGSFDWIGGELMNGLACLDAQTATANTEWAPMPDDDVEFLACHDGCVYAAGWFDEIGGLSNVVGLARLDPATGQADPDWTPFAGADAWPEIADIAFAGSNVVLVGNFFGVGEVENAQHLVRVNIADGKADPDWLPQPNAACVQAVALGNVLFAFGEFTEMDELQRFGCAKLVFDVPDAPEAVFATKNLPDRVDVSWDASAIGETFELWRGISTNPADATLVAEDLATGLYRDTEVAVGERNYYWLRKVNSLGASDFSMPDQGWRRSLAALCGTIGDYDGDAISDLAVYDQNNCSWYIYSIADEGSIIAWNVNWGQIGDITVVGDYDGDAISDLAVFHPDGGPWYVYSLDEGVLGWNKRLGWHGFIPVSGDYDGDGMSDMAVYNPEDGAWYVYSLEKNEIIAWAELWGGGGYIPVSGDFDGDGASDLAVYNPNDGAWYIWSLKQDELIAWNAVWGGPGFEPVSGDFDGDGVSDLAVYCEEIGAWYVASIADEGATIAWNVPWGGQGYIPVPGDFDGDGASDWAVFSPVSGNWHIQSSARGPVIIENFAFGGNGIVPVTAAGR